MILVAEDDPDDRLLLREAFHAFEDACETRFVEDGEELMEVLRQDGRYAKSAPPRPKLILLDLSMPKKDGWEALAEIRECADFKDIPLVVWTTSMLEEDRIACEEAGATAFVTKPNTYVEMDAAIRNIVHAWLQDSPG